MIKKRKKIKYLRQNELDRFFEQVKNVGSKRDMAIFNLAYWVGLRVSEVGLLTVDDFNERASEIYVPRLKNSIPCTRKLKQPLKQMIIDYLKTRTPFLAAGSPLFISKQNRPISRAMLHLLFKKYAEMARLPKESRHFHTLRHSIGVHLSDAEVEVKEVQWVLGHANIKNTMVYMSFTRTQQKAFEQKIRQNQRFLCI